MKIAEKLILFRQSFIQIGHARTNRSGMQQENNTQITPGKKKT